MSFYHISYIHILLYFSSDRAYKNYPPFVIFRNEVKKKHGTSKGAILHVDVISVDLNQTILIFLKHDISELTGCSEVVNISLALFKMKIKLFELELDV